MRTILSISQDDRLLLTRTAVLRKTDAEVIAASAGEAKKILKTQRFDLMVLCHSLTSEDTLEIVGLARKKTAAMPILKILANTDFDSEWALVASGTTVSYDPDLLVAKVTELLSVSPLETTSF
jgi:DNA-binding response OmpR family regulator